MPTLCYGIKNKILLHWSRIITSNSIIIGLLKTESYSIDLIPSGITMMHSEGWSPPNNQMTALGLTYEAMTPAHQWWWQPHVYNHGYSLEKKKKNYACHDPSPPSIAVRARRSLTKLKVMYDLFSYTGFRLAVGLANCSVDFCIDYTDILQNFHVVVALGTTSGSQPAVVPAHWSSCTASHASKFNEHYHAIPVMERAPVRFFPRRKADTTIHSSRSPRRALRKVGPSSGRAHLCRNPSDSPSKCHGFFFFQRPQQVTCTKFDAATATKGNSSTRNSLQKRWFRTWSMNRGPAGCWVMACLPAWPHVGWENPAGTGENRRIRPKRRRS